MRVEGKEAPLHRLLLCPKFVCQPVIPPVLS